MEANAVHYDSALEAAYDHTDHIGHRGIFRSDFGLFYQLPKDSGALYPVTNVIDTFVYRGLINMGTSE